MQHKERLDVLLVSRGLSESREKAKANFSLLSLAKLLGSTSPKIRIKMVITAVEIAAAAQAEAFSTLHLVLAAVCDVRGELGQPVCFYLAGLSDGRTHAGG